MSEKIKIARDLFILENVPLETISKTLKIPIKKLQNVHDQNSWSFIKGEMNTQFGSQLLDLNMSLTQVYKNAMEKALELLPNVRTPRQMSDLMGAIRLIDQGMMEHYGVNSLISVVKEQEKRKIGG